MPVGEVIAVIAAQKPEAHAARTGEEGSNAAAGHPSPLERPGGR